MLGGHAENVSITSGGQAWAWLPETKDSPMKSSGLFAGAIFALGVLLFVNAPRASSHALYDHSIPASGAVVTTPPTVVDVYFVESLYREGATHLHVTGPNGNEVDTGGEQFDMSNLNRMYIALQPNLGPGVYTVNWETQSAKDGHIADGSFTFTIAGSPPAPTTARPTTTGSAPVTPAQPTSSTSTPAASSGQPTVSGVPTAGGGPVSSRASGWLQMAAALAFFGSIAVVTGATLRSRRS
jgi:methionine-rich copper-binding protein CopC